MLDFVTLISLEDCCDSRYFVAAPDHKPGERHLYRTGDLNISSPDTREMDCLTCPPMDPSQSPPHHGLGPPHSTVMSGDIK
jgi:hypothetical protein